VAVLASLTPPLAAPTLGFVRVLPLTPLGHSPIDKHLDLRISQELSLQVRVDVGVTSGHDEQITRHLPVLQAARSSRTKKGRKPEAL
jgi:hypothetical protein